MDIREMFPRIMTFAPQLAGVGASSRDSIGCRSEHASGRTYPSPVAPVASEFPLGVEYRTTHLSYQRT